MQGRIRYKLIVFLFVLVFSGFISKPNVGAISEHIYITVKVNDNCIKMDEEPYIKDGRTFVSIRFVAEALNAKVGWVDEKKMVTIDDGYNYIEIFINNKEYSVNAVKQVIDVAPEICKGRTMVPLKLISESLGCSIEWDGETYTVAVEKSGIKVPDTSIRNRGYTDEDLIWLSRIVTVEARGASIEGKLAVANVVLNRVKSPVFPNTVYDVIFQRGQFPPAHKNGFKELQPPRDCVIVSKMALEGVNNIGKCLYFNNAEFPSRSGSFYKKIGGEYFYN
ncbi:MAG: copper amine oxidase [Clostridium sp.]|nr:copper amine oxidase [Clostridium sp.]